MGVKNCCFLFIFAIGLLLFPNTALGVDSETLISEQYDQLELDELKNYLERLDKTFLNQPVKNTGRCAQWGI